MAKSILMLFIIACQFSYSDELFAAFPDEVKQARSAVYIVKINSDSGTGFFIGEKTFIFNFHGLSSLNTSSSDFIHDIEIWNENRSRRIPIKSIKSLSADFDLVVLETEEPGDNYLTLGNTQDDFSFDEASPVPFENKEENFKELFSMGFPAGRFEASKRIGSLKSWTPYSYSFFSSVSSRHPIGVSGSPVINSKGEVIGILFQALTNMRVAINSKYIQKVLDGENGVQCSAGRYAQCVDDAIDLVEKAAREGTLTFQTPGMKIVINHLKNQFFHNDSGFFDFLIRGRLAFGTEDYEELLKQEFEWSIRLAELDDIQSQHSAVLFYLYGKKAVVEKDYDQAFDWAEVSAERGFAPSEYLLGTFYYQRRNRNQAIYWLEKSANQGFIEAQRFLAEIYGKYASSDNPEYLGKSVYWYKTAAEIGDAESQKIISTYYFRGFMVKEDQEQAIYWLKKAAETGDAQAQYMVFFEYYQKSSDDDTIFDKKTAIEWLIRSAENQLPLAQYQLGYMHHTGINGLEKSDDIAIHWLDQAAAQGFEEAKILSLRLSRSQSPLERIIDKLFSKDE